MHKLHSHPFKHTIILKIFKDMHLLVFPLLETNLEETLHAFIEKPESINTKNSQTMINLKDTLTKFTSAFIFQEKGKFSSQL